MSEIAEFFTDYQTKRTENPARTHRYTLTRLVKPQTGPGRMGGGGGQGGPTLGAICPLILDVRQFSVVIMVTC